MDPQPFSADEDRAAELGIRSVNVGGNAGNALYSGWPETNSTDGHAAIDFLDPNKGEYLEYDPGETGVPVERRTKPVIGWLSELPMSAGFDPTSGQPRAAWVILEQIQHSWTCACWIPTSPASIPAISVLVLVHPKHLSAATRFAIDQFALRGGHILVSWIPSRIRIRPAPIRRTRPPH